MEATQKTVEANGVIDGYIRLVVTRGVGSLGLNPFTCETPMIIIIADNIQLYPEGALRKGDEDNQRDDGAQSSAGDTAAGKEFELPE